MTLDKRRFVSCALGVSVGLLGALALSAQDSERGSSPDRSLIGRWQVSGTTGGPLLLLDTATGRVWTGLQSAEDGALEWGDSVAPPK